MIQLFYFGSSFKQAQPLPPENGSHGSRPSFWLSKPFWLLSIRSLFISVPNCTNRSWYTVQSFCAQNKDATRACGIFWVNGKIPISASGLILCAADGAGAIGLPLRFPNVGINHIM